MLSEFGADVEAVIKEFDDVPVEILVEKLSLKPSASNKVRGVFFWEKSVHNRYWESFGKFVLQWSIL